jgi:hypothetical protein
MLHHLSLWILGTCFLLLQVTDDVTEQSPNVNFIFFCHTSWYTVCTNILHYYRSAQTILCTVPTYSSNAVNKYQILTCQLSGIISSPPATFTSIRDVLSLQMSWLSVGQLSNSLCQFLTCCTVIMLLPHTYTNCCWIQWGKYLLPIKT